jgi:energy-coupling factor transporter ATP-binding protein EcfA2
MELATEDRVMLRAALYLAFQDYEPFALFLKDHCSQLVSQWTHRDAGMETVVASTIERAGQYGWLDGFLSALKTHGAKPIASIATTLETRLAAQRPVLYSQARADPLGALFLADEECFIGRKNLRYSLRQLELDTTNRSVLCVTGDSGSGKSYSFRLLKLLDNLSPSNVVVRIDFKNFREGALAQRYRDIVDTINTRLQMSFDKIPPQNETDARWFENAVITFDNVVRERDQKLWLVFDHIEGKHGIEPSIHDALSKLVRYATIDSQRLRIVLIDMAHSQLRLERDSKRLVDTDVAALPSQQEVGEFLREVRQTANVALTDQVIDDAARDIFSELAQCSEEDYPWELSPLTWSQVLRLQLVGARP